jgi:hypothetical protein
LPAYRALAHGHVIEFISGGPAYLGSMLLRAPSALIALWLGGTAREVYFAAALPGLLAAPVLGGWLMARGSRFAPGHILLLVILVFPTTVVCVNTGHPEDVLTAALAIAATVQAANGRGTSAGALVALAVASKPWAACAVPVAFVVCDDKRRFLMAAAAVSVAFWGPIIIIREATLGAGAGPGTVAASTGTIFGSPQLLYWLGPGDWLSQHAHALIVLASCCVAGLWWVLRRGDDDSGRLASALWLLALVFFIRSAFDPWNSAYYPLPFLMTILALGSWRAAGLAVVASVVLFVADSPNMTFALSAGEGARTFAIVAIPVLFGLTATVFWPPHRRVIAPAVIRALRDYAGHRGAARNASIARSS